MGAASIPFQGGLGWKCCLKVNGELRQHDPGFWAMNARLKDSHSSPTAGAPHTDTHTHRAPPPPHNSSCTRAEEIMMVSPRGVL